MNVDTRHVRYVFTDVVDFTEHRTVEAQVEIIDALNATFREALGELETIYLPTGDGICAGIIQADVPADVHLQVALRALEAFYNWSSKAGSNRAAAIRVAINESVDAVVTDINGRRNLAGTGINSAQRLMSVADGNQIIVGRAAYDTLHVRDRYWDAFREMKAVIKHGRVIPAYQFVGLRADYLNTDVPIAVQRAEAIDVEMLEALAVPGGYSTAGMVDAIFKASELWRKEIEVLTHELSQKCNDEQRKDLAAADRAWKAFYEAESTFIGSLRKTTMGSMFRVSTASIHKKLARGRARALREYLEDWTPGDSTVGQ